METLNFSVRKLTINVADGDENFSATIRYPSYARKMEIEEEYAKCLVNNSGKGAGKLLTDFFLELGATKDVLDRMDVESMKELLGALGGTKKN